MPERLMQIGELAQRTGLSLPTLRHYDETGLLSPSARTAGKFRLYSEADFEKLMVIRRMKPLGFTIEEMRRLLVIVATLRSAEHPSDGQAAELLAQLRSYLDDAAERRAKLQRQVDRADEFIAILEREERSAALIAGAGAPGGSAARRAEPATAGSPDGG